MLNPEAKTIVARLYVENGGNDLSTLPPWILVNDAKEYLQYLREDEAQHEYPDREIDRVLIQDIVSRRKEAR